MFFRKCLNLVYCMCKLELVYLSYENLNYIRKDDIERNLNDYKNATGLDNENDKRRVYFVCFAFLLLLRHLSRDTILARFDWLKFFVRSLVRC